MLPPALQDGGDWGDLDPGRRSPRRTLASHPTDEDLSAGTPAWAIVLL